VGMGFCNNCMWCRKKPQGVIISLKIFLQAHTYHTTVIPTNHPAFCLIIKQKYCLSHQKIAKSLFLVLTCIAPCLYILNGHTAFSRKNTPNQAQRFICRLVGMEKALFNCGPLTYKFPQINKFFRSALGRLHSQTFSAVL
jgi:hypothetical protein